MTDEIKIERREDGPTHFLVRGLVFMDIERFDNEPDAWSRGLARAEASGDKVTVYRSVAEFEPVQPVKEPDTAVHRHRHRRTGSQQSVLPRESESDVDGHNGT